MKKIELIFGFVLVSIGILYAQHGFPEGHYCNSEEGWNTKSCKALYGLKSEDKDKVIVVPHRGLWGAEGVPETSRLAVQEAYNAGYMFCEIDLVLTKDQELVLCHDQQPNRLTNAPATFSVDGGVDDPGNFFRSLNFYQPTNNTVPNVHGKMYETFPALNTLYYKDRFGNVTDEKLNTFDQILDYVKDKDIVLEIDIKGTKLSDATRMNEYLKALSLTLQKAKNKGLLHKIILKPASSGKIHVQDVKSYLTAQGQWDDFSKHTNIILIDITGAPLSDYRSYIDNWLAIPSLIGVEYIYKVPDDNLLVPRADFDNKSIVQYTKDKGFKTGVFHPTPTDQSGSQGGRGNYYNPTNFGTLTDLRGSLEFLFGVPQNVYPSILVTDRPDADMNYLELFDLNSKYTKRNF